jgi:hypothetical protein
MCDVCGSSEWKTKVELIDGPYHKALTFLACDDECVNVGIANRDLLKKAMALNEPIL